MKLKNLRKKVRRLEKRLQEGPRKLAKLRRRLEEMETAKATAAGTKSTPRVPATRETARRLTPTQRKAAEPTDAQKRGAPVKTVKRKLNLSPERRAQLSALMKARWAAKRAAGEANVTGVEQASPLETVAEATESKHNGA